MILRHLAVAKFRNLDRQRIEFCGGVNCLYGRNGQGKSNVLEAVYYLAHLRSFRASSSDELVRWGEDVLLLEGAVEEEGGQRTRLFVSCGGGARRLKVNGRPIVRTLDFLRHLHIGFFSSQALSLVSGAPEERRRFLDQQIFYLHRPYGVLCQQYRRIVRQRNAILRAGGKDKALKEVWDARLVDVGGQIAAMRIRYTGALGRALESVRGLLGPRGVEVQLRYRPSAGGVAMPGGDVQGRELAKGFAAWLSDHQREESRRGFSLFGPHRDDLEILWNGRPVRNFGSQGEQRLAALMLVIAAAKHGREARGESPILVLDDFESELDAGRRARLLSFFDDAVHQVILTSTEEMGVSFRRENAAYRVEAGRILRC